MAAKFVLVVALFASCHANPVLINGVLYRDGRSYSFGKASSFGPGVSTAQANVHGDAAQAYGSSTGGAQLARDGYIYPGQQSIAQAQAFNTLPYPVEPVSEAQAVAYNGGHYPVPAPATVITYEQHFAPADASSVSSATSNGGVAESSANAHGGVGGYGVTSSNSKTYGSGFGSADSKANSGSSFTSTSAKTHGHGSASSTAQNNGIVGVVYPVGPAVVADDAMPAVVDVKTPIFHTAYVPSAPAQGFASSNAQVVGSGSAASSAKLSHGRTISWRFGTMYDAPASAHAQANTHSGYGAAKSAAHTHGYGSAAANADTNGFGSAKSIADAHSAGQGIAQSSANSNGAGSANANAAVNSAGYGGARSTADVHGAYHGSRSSADAQIHGFGKASSSASTQGVNTAFRMTNSQAHSSGYGAAQANALTV